MKLILKDYLLIMTVLVIWSLNFIIIDNTLKHIDTYTLLIIRLFFSSLGCVFFLSSFNLKNINFKYLLLNGLIFGFGMFGMLIWGMQLGVTPSAAATLLQSQILFTFIISSFRNKNWPNLYCTLGIIASLLGMITLLISQNLNINSIIGCLLVVMSGFLWAISNQISNYMQISKEYYPLNFNLSLGVSFLISIIMQFILNYHQLILNIHQVLITMDLKIAFSIIYLGFISTSIAFGIWFYLIRKNGPMAISPWSQMVPMITLLLSVLMYNRVFHFLDFLSILLVLLSTFILTRK